MLLRAVGYCLVVSSFASGLSGEPVRLSTPAFGESAEVEVRGLSAGPATAAARAVLLEIDELARLTDPDSTLEGSLGMLNAKAGESHELDPRVARVLLRALSYCLWSNGAHGPLAGDVYRLWADSTAVVPEPEELRRALAGAECNRLNIRRDPGPGRIMQAAIAEGTRVDLLGLAKGFAIDRAFEILAEHGVDNAWVELGNVVRAVGGGPEGAGWPFTVPSIRESKEGPEEVLLRDQALAIAGVGASGESEIRWIDQRTGVPARGVIQVVAVAQPAFDAQALATILYITGLREGQRQLGALQPRPSIRWFLGDSADAKVPLESTYRWSEVVRFRR